MTKEKPKKKNPQDATMRNINALKKRVAILESLVCAQAAFNQTVSKFMVASTKQAEAVDKKLGKKKVKK